jgi:decaprenylphospho-beta-D-erythro-pentofuranosid-2-ulose 2-reductase
MWNKNLVASQEESMKHILILGATSSMAKALAEQLASHQVRLILAGRQVKDMEKTAQDLMIRGKGLRPVVIPFDAQHLENHGKFFTEVLTHAGAIDEAYLFFGQMYPQQEAQRRFQLAFKMLTVNYLSAVSILECIAAYMEKRNQGLIVAISSVAGDRGRQSNYLYGSSKAGLTAYLQGLRNRLAHAGVHVMTVKPGFVDTPMTQGLKKNGLFVSPQAIATGIIMATKKQKNVVYIPWYWRWIMLLIRLIPEAIFKKMKM